jgi:hypothetical protein
MSAQEQQLHNLVRLYKTMIRFIHTSLVRTCGQKCAQRNVDATHASGSEIPGVIFYRQRHDRRGVPESFEADVSHIKQCSCGSDLTYTRNSWSQLGSVPRFTTLVCCFPDPSNSISTYVFRDSLFKSFLVILAEPTGTEMSCGRLFQGAMQSPDSPNRM